VDRLRHEVQRLQQVDRFVGLNPKFLQAQMLAIKSAQSRDAGVLLQGESGAGKELFARLIHGRSPRADYPFVALNCAAFSTEIIESELFGYEKGAFTGARAEGKEGLLEVADGGTLFLDEVSDLHLEIQAKLLRVLEEKEFFPLGGTRKRTVDIRILSACNTDLWQGTEEGRFRKDLFFRLATIRIDLPPLRERTEDILPLVHFFMDEFNDKYGKHFRRVNAQAERLLLAHSWPGNVRELKNVLEQASILNEDGIIKPQHMPVLAEKSFQEMAGTDDGTMHLDEKLNLMEKEMIMEALRKAGGIQVKAAGILGINQRSLWHRIKKLQIDVNGIKNLQ